MTTPQPDRLVTAADLLAVTTRNGVMETAHLGHMVATTDSGDAVRVGDPDLVILPRSTVKPLQAVGMLRAGLDLPDDLLALACASHNGEAAHLAGAGRILTGAGLSESSLRNVSALPHLDTAALAWQQGGRGPEPIAQGCSGKHAAMLATASANSWDLAAYLEPEHPLQQLLRRTIAELTGDDPGIVAVDGCGAPLFGCTLRGLARAFARLAAAPWDAPASAEARVARAMSAHPFMVAGGGRSVTALMSAIPGLIAKDGAQGVYALALPTGRSAAVKVLDGAELPAQVAVAAAARALGVDHPILDQLSHVAVLGGSQPVGLLEAVALAHRPTPPR